MLCQEDGQESVAVPSELVSETKSSLDQWDLVTGFGPGVDSDKNDKLAAVVYHEMKGWLLL